MLSKKSLVSVLVGGLAAVAALFAGSALANFTAPCTSSAINSSSFNFVPLNGGGQTYCQSAWGWSDTWFPTAQPSTYDQHLDVLSGDNAPSLYYFIGTQKIGAGDGFPSNPQNFMSPFIDGGDLNSKFIGSSVTVKPGGDINGTTGKSLVALGILDIEITTAVGLNGITETFLFTNTSNQLTITDLFFNDYFNFHANGSLSTTDTACPLTNYDVATGTVTTKGFNDPINCAPIVKDGSMHGSFNPIKWDVGLAKNVLSNVGAGNYNFYNQSGNAPDIKGDGAADLLWSLGALGPGGQTTFTISKNFTPVPEPATLLLFGAGLAGMGLIRRRRS